MTTRRPIMKYDPTVTLGNWITMASVLVAGGIAWGVITTKVDAQSNTMANQQREFTAAIADVKEATKDLRSELKDVQKTVNMITADTALIRGRLTGDNTTSVRK